MSEQLSLLDSAKKNSADKAVAQTGKEEQKRNESKPVKANAVKTKPTGATERPPAVTKEPTILTVSQLNSAIKSSLESEFRLVWIRGEISNFTAHGSGHFYFSLKDGKSQISAVMFRGANSHLNFKPKVGDEVIARARVSVYVPRGNYQVLVEVMEPVGAGAMQRKFEELKKKLASEGLFASDRKLKLPRLPQKIAVITSPTGAAVKDIINVLGRRYSAAEILVIPALVQGEGAAASLLKCLKMLSLLKDVDVAIIGRGGGSIEDLWAFNDEKLARAISDFKIPIISAVGHEIDFTICDFVADLRAPTPSAAAEVVAQSAAELSEKVSSQQKQLIHQMRSSLRDKNSKCDFFERRLVHPSRRLQELAQRCDDLVSHLQRAMDASIKTKRHSVETLRYRIVDPKRVVEKRFADLKQLNLQLKASIEKRLSGDRNKTERLMGILDSLSPLKVLDRGYALVQDDKGKVVSADSVVAGQTVNIKFSGAQAQAEILSVDKESK